MKFLHDIRERVRNSKAFLKLKSIKNIEIVIAIVLTIIAAVAYFLVTASGNRSESSAKEFVQMTEEERRLAELISEIAGVGKASVLITTGSDETPVGVVVVMEGAEKVENRVNVIRCVEKATGATVDQIEIFKMENGG